MIRRPPRSTRTDTLFPYPTLFRSTRHGRRDNPGAGNGAHSVPIGGFMARPFSYPEVAALEVGQAARVDDNPTAIRRKVNEYAKRSEKLFSIARLSGCQSALEIGRASCRERVCQYV